jgi:predicted MFS family arabinose efflux permease
VSTVAGPLIGILAATLIADFEITRAEVGRLAAAYALVGAAVSPATGRLTDRIGGRRMLALTCLVSSGAFVVLASARSYWVLLVGAVISGFPNGSGNQATNHLIAAFLPPAERGLVTGVKQSGVQLGRFLGGLLAPTGVLVIGLSATFLVIAIISLVVAGFALAMLPGEPSEPGRARGAPGGGGPAEGLPTAVWWLASYAFLLGAGAGATFAFTALYAVESLGFEETTAGLLVGVTGAMAAVSRIVLSRATQGVAHFGPALGWIALGASASLVLTAAAASLGGWALWAGASLAAVTLGSWNSVAMVATMAAVPPRQSGRASGRVMLGFLGGLGLVPPAFGAAVDRVGSYPACWLALAGVAVLAAVAMWAWAARDRMVAAEAVRA